MSLPPLCFWRSKETRLLSEGEEMEHASTPFEELEWMWGDAGSFPLIGGVFARANPLRWSRGTPEKVAEELGEGGKYSTESRPVQLRVTGQSYTYQRRINHNTITWWCFNIPR